MNILILHQYRIILDLKFIVCFIMSFCACSSFLALYLFLYRYLVLVFYVYDCYIGIIDQCWAVFMFCYPLVYNFISIQLFVQQYFYWWVYLRGGDIFFFAISNYVIIMFNTIIVGKYMVQVVSNMYLSMTRCNYQLKILHFFLSLFLFIYFYLYFDSNLFFHLYYLLISDISLIFEFYFLL
ncbi:hypothetical protein ABPG72_013632 [Tetrahymena utriculariae]